MKLARQDSYVLFGRPFLVRANLGGCAKPLGAPVLLSPAIALQKLPCLAFTHCDVRGQSAWLRVSPQDPVTNP